MNVTLTATLEQFVRGKVESGDFRSAEEVVSEGLRLLQRQDEQWAASAKAKIDEGWAQAKSGQLRSPEAVRENLAERKAAWLCGVLNLKSARVAVTESVIRPPPHRKLETPQNC